MLASKAGGDYSQVHNGVLLNVSARVRNGLTFQGGFGTGTTRTDYCAVRAVTPEYTVLGAQSPTNPWCNTSTGWVTRATGLGSYTVPKVDMRFAKILRFGRTRTNVGFDVYNILNSAPVLTYNQAFNPNVLTGSSAWLAPQSTLQPRFFKFSAQIDF
jgi:hypothetical protein